jgi:hypothetical protein
MVEQVLQIQFQEVQFHMLGVVVEVLQMVVEILGELDLLVEVMVVAEHVYLEVLQQLTLEVVEVEEVVMLLQVDQVDQV